MSKSFTNLSFCYIVVSSAIITFAIFEHFAINNMKTVNKCVLSIQIYIFKISSREKAAQKYKTYYSADDMPDLTFNKQKFSSTAQSFIFYMSYFSLKY